MDRSNNIALHLPFPVTMSRFGRWCLVRRVVDQAIFGDDITLRIPLTDGGEWMVLLQQVTSSLLLLLHAALPLIVELQQVTIFARVGHNRQHLAHHQPGCGHQVTGGRPHGIR